MLQDLSQAVIWMAAFFLLAISFYQRHLVNWKENPCGCIGVYALGASSAWTLFRLAEGMIVNPSMAAMVASFTLWLVCRVFHKKINDGLFGVGS
jgi:hypothetical protein